MLVLSLAIIPLLVIPLTTELSPSALAGFRLADVVIWAAFAVEYLVRLCLAPRKRHFVVRNLPDLALVFLPFLRPLRLLRVLRLARVLLLVTRAIRGSRRALGHHGLVYVLLVTAFVVVAGVIVVHDVEAGHPGSSITTWGDAARWTMETVATARSETSWPASDAGHVVRVVLVLLGLALFGFVTASLASWFVEVEDDRRDLRRHRELEARLARLQATLDELVAERSPQGAVGDAAAAGAAETA